jgi:uncharacterized membrane protein (DUF4010 family)
VVLIAALSFAGYVATRVVGPERGVMLTGLLGGLTSSTAVTISFSRLYRESPSSASLLAAAAATASAMMLPRLLIVVGVLQPGLLPLLIWPFAAAAVASLAVVLLLWWRSRKETATAPVTVSNPFEFWSAVRFGALLAAIMLLSRAVPAWLGDQGLLLLAAISGAADVDAITLSVSRLVDGGLAPTVAALAILIAVLANTIVKAGIAAFGGGAALGWRLGLTFVAGAVAGAVAFGLQPDLPPTIPGG